MTFRNQTVSPDCNSKSSGNGRGEDDQQAAESLAEEKRQVQALDDEDDASSMASEDIAEWLDELDREGQLTDVEGEARDNGAEEQPLEPGASREELDGRMRNLRARAMGGTVRGSTAATSSGRAASAPSPE